MTTETYASSVNGGSPVSLNYGYNLAGQLISMTGGQNDATLSPNIYTAQSIGPSGPTLVQFGNGVYSPYWYDSMGRLYGGWACSGSTQAGCGGGTQYYGFLRTIVGNEVTAMVDTVVNENAQLGYDEFGRLTSQNYLAGGVDTDLSFVYDRYGNRWQQNVTQGSGPQPQFSFNPANNQISGYQYDAAGNVINDGAHSYTYDAENNLISIDGGTTASYAYDALNERVEENANGGTAFYDFDLSGRRSTVWSPTSYSITAVQYYAGASRVAYWTAADGNIHFEHQDWLGTERVRTSATGAVEGTYSSLPFGDNEQVTGSDSNEGHFAMLDQDVDSSLGLSHATFREYSSTAGRWMSPDSYAGSYSQGNPQSLNRYAYVSNGPLSAVDATGLDQEMTCVSSDDAGMCDSGTGADGSDGDGTGSPDDGLSNGTGSDPNNPGPCAGGADDPTCVSVSACTGQIDCVDIVNPQGTPLCISNCEYISQVPLPQMPSLAPNNPQTPQRKSPARQQCEARAAQELASSSQQLQSSFGPNIKTAAKDGFVGGAIAGCIFGAVAATATVVGTPAAPEACVGGAVIGIIDGVGLGVSTSIVHSGISGIQAILKYNQEMKACAAL